MNACIRSCLLTVAAFLLAAVAVAPSLLAADGLLPLPSPLLAQDGVELIPYSRSYVVESVVVAALISGALFAVCKSSRRS